MPHLQRMSKLGMALTTMKTLTFTGMVNMRFSHNRLGVPLALALLAILLHKHNCKMEQQDKFTLLLLQSHQNPTLALHQKRKQRKLIGYHFQVPALFKVILDESMYLWNLD